MTNVAVDNASLVSVIVPAYNAAAFIVETLESVKNQTYARLECIVVDDGSTDNTAEMVKNWIRSDERFIYVHQSNKGLSGARNTGMDNARGAFFQFLDADDVLRPTKLAVQVALMQSEEAQVSYTDYSTGISSDVYTPSTYYRSAQFKTGQWLEELIERWESSLVIPPHCFLFRAELFREHGIRFDTSLPNHEDFDCWVHIFRLRPVIRYIDQKLCIYRITDNSMSKKMRAMGEGFLEVMKNQIGVSGQSKQLRSLLEKKRREILKRYYRFDRMTFLDKIFMFGFVTKYYSSRLLQKSGLKK